MSLSLAPARAQDFELLLALRILVMQPQLERIGRFDPIRARERFAKVFNPDTARLIMAGGIQIGCVGMTPGTPDWSLDYLYLEPELQGRGIGGRVLDWVLAEADQAGAPVVVEVLRNSPAIRLYERAGFKQFDMKEHDVYLRRAAAKPTG
ncbi:GNAT family N-acetyltransferase [Lacibacterium aquatile]|uniref:GNAT family N-acetyltransferase n=1 Tax=Lacibacterium aquatile TaxID=1168082 RepID=A0ABW5DX36_9PROT